MWEDDDPFNFASLEAGIPVYVCIYMYVVCHVLFLESLYEYNHLMPLMWLILPVKK